MPCKAVGTPEPIIIWEKDNHQLILSSEVNSVLFVDLRGTLKIKDLKLTDSGTYKCIAKNLAGEAIKAFNLLVISKYDIFKLNLLS